MEAGLPDGVLNVVTGPGAVLGDTLLDLELGAISFTGSTDVGRPLYERASAHGIRCQCEMGGKNPLIVLEDADLDAVVELAIDGAFRSAGQKCTATSRIIVERPLYQAFMVIAQEEIFGPVAAVLEAADFDDAIRLANETRFGLSASICTENLSRAHQFVQRVEAGLVGVNVPTAGVEFQAPFGGIKGSGTPFKEQGKVAGDFYTHTKTVALKYQGS